MRTKTIRVLGMAVLALAGCVASFARSATGELTGAIFDASDETTTQSTTTGEYRIPSLPVGIYQVTVTVSGFSKAQLRTLEAQWNKAATLDTTTASVQDVSANASAELPIAAGGAGGIKLSLVNAGIGSSGAVGFGAGPSVGRQTWPNNAVSECGVQHGSTRVSGAAVTNNTAVPQTHGSILYSVDLDPKFRKI